MQFPRVREQNLEKDACARVRELRTDQQIVRILVMMKVSFQLGLQIKDDEI